MFTKRVLGLQSTTEQQETETSLFEDTGMDFLEIPIEKELKVTIKSLDNNYYIVLNANMASFYYCFLHDSFHSKLTINSFTNSKQETIKRVNVIIRNLKWYKQHVYN